MRLTRRSLFGLFGGAVVAPIAAKLHAAEPVTLSVDLAAPGADSTVLTLLRQMNPLMEHIEAAQTDFIRQHVIRTSLPGVAWRKLYEGVPSNDDA